MRDDIAHLAGVSTGNVTKVKQILTTACPELLSALRQGTVSIHRGWTWRQLPQAQQREALWKHQHQSTINHTIRDLIARHCQAPHGEDEAGLRTDQQRVLERLSMGVGVSFAFCVANIPGHGLVITRELYERLRQAERP